MSSLYVFNELNHGFPSLGFYTHDDQTFAGPYEHSRELELTQSLLFRVDSSPNEPLHVEPDVAELVFEAEGYGYVNDSSDLEIVSDFYRRYARQEALECIPYDTYDSCDSDDSSLFSSGRSTPWTSYPCTPELATIELPEDTTDALTPIKDAQERGYNDGSAGTWRLDQFKASENLEALTRDLTGLGLEVAA